MVSPATVLYNSSSVKVCGRNLIHVDGGQAVKLLFEETPMPICIGHTLLW